MSPLHVVYTMTANRPNFCQPWLATPIRGHFFCIFVPGKTGQPILGHVYMTHQVGHYDGLSTFTSWKEGKKGPQNWEGKHLQKKERR